MANEFEPIQYLTLYFLIWLGYGNLGSPLPSVSELYLNSAATRSDLRVFIDDADFDVTGLSASNNTALLFTNLGASEVSGLIWLNLMRWDLPSPFMVEDGDRVRFPIGSVEFEFVDGNAGVGVLGITSHVVEQFITFIFEGVFADSEDRYLGLRDSGVELSGGGYARYFLDTEDYTDGYLTFSSLPAATIDGWGIYDAPTGGNLLFYGDYRTPRVVSAGDGFIHGVNSSFSQVGIGGLTIEMVN